MTNLNAGIQGKLKRAQSKQEIDALLSEVAMFQNASPKTVRRCKRIAARRLAQLEDGE